MTRRMKLTMITMVKVDHNVTPRKWQRNKGEEGDEDDKNNDNHDGNDKYTTSKIDDNIAPCKWQGDEGEEGDEDDKNKSWRLLLRPEKNSMDVIPERSKNMQHAEIFLTMLWLRGEMKVYLRRYVKYRMVIRHAVAPAT